MNAHIKTIASTISISLSLVISACSTTGDPTKGGLFGWSEAKALDRQNELSGKAQSATQDRNVEVAKTAELARSETELRAETSLLANRLAILTSENVRLENQLKTLRQRERKANTDVDRLIVELQSLRQTQQLSESAFANQYNTQEKETYLARISRLNDKLVDAILLYVTP